MNYIYSYYSYSTIRGNEVGTILKYSTSQYFIMLTEPQWLLKVHCLYLEAWETSLPCVFCIVIDKIGHKKNKK